jgi:alkylated DNA repair dioxygenase AlkB
MGYDLFNPPPENFGLPENNITINRLEDIRQINGLRYIPSYVTREEHDQLVATIQSMPWLTDIKRRVQHYGWKYDYKVRSIDYSMYMGELPYWVAPLALRIFNDGYISTMPDQMIVNEYLPGQGIAPHIDCEPCFEDTVISISLLSPVVMDFAKIKSTKRTSVLLEPRSLVVISGEARYSWTHGIAARKTDVFWNERFQRKLRISLTFRKVKLHETSKKPLTYSNDCQIKDI